MLKKLNIPVYKITIIDNLKLYIQKIIIDDYCKIGSGSKAYRRIFSN